MRRYVLWFALIFALALPSSAQEASDQPIIRTELDPASVLTGQPATLRVTVLVPSFFSKPVTLPSYDLPNIMVELPDEATRPVSERVQGRNWSGVRREYQITPLVPGEISLPPQTISFTYADASYQPVEATAMTDALTLTGTVPAAAQSLDPFLAATSLTLEQVIEGAEGELAPGAAITRTVTASISGAKAMTIPPLLPPLDQPGLSEHPNAPDMSDDAESSTGTRIESVTYIAEQGGRYSLPAITLSWYNIDADRVEQATLDGAEIAVSGPAPAETKQPVDWRGIAVIAVAIALLSAVFWVLWRRFVPVAEDHLRKLREARRASPRYAWHRADQALQNYRLGAALTWTGRWWRRGGLPPSDDLNSAYLELGKGLYGPHPTPDDRMQDRWSAARQALKTQARHHPRQGRGQDSDLPPLNP